MEQARIFQHPDDWKGNDHGNRKSDHDSADCSTDREEQNGERQPDYEKFGKPDCDIRQFRRSMLRFHSEPYLETLQTMDTITTMDTIHTAMDWTTSTVSEMQRMLIDSL